MRNLRSFFVSLYRATILAVIASETSILWAQDSQKPQDMEWAVSYFVVLFLLMVAIAVLSRPTKRNDTVLTAEEQFAEKQERLKQAH